MPGERRVGMTPPAMGPRAAPAVRRRPFDFLLVAPRVRASLRFAVRRHTNVEWDVVGHLAAATGLVILHAGREEEAAGRKRGREE